MTEAEWLEGEDPQALLDFITGRTNERKRWLFACACCHRVPLRLQSPEKVCFFIETVERFVDGKVSATDVYDSQVDALCDPSLKCKGRGDSIWSNVSAGWALWPTLKLEEVMRYGREVAEYEELVRAAKLSSQKRSYRWWKRQPKLSENDFLEATSRGRVAEQRVYCEQLRDIFGNPFRPVSFSPSWRSSTAVSLAAQVYESRDFGAMPILADALQDAGCENEDILSHCRGAGPHVRGCWVVDLVLGKD